MLKICRLNYSNSALDNKEIYGLPPPPPSGAETMTRAFVETWMFGSRFSGLKKEDVEKAKRSLADIQYRLKKIFCEDTILVGHSLESDFKALKVIL